MESFNIFKQRQQRQHRRQAYPAVSSCCCHGRFSPSPGLMVCSGKCSAPLNARLLTLLDLASNFLLEHEELRIVRTKSSGAGSEWFIPRSKRSRADVEVELHPEPPCFGPSVPSHLHAHHSSRVTTQPSGFNCLSIIRSDHQSTPPHPASERIHQKEKQTLTAR